MAPAGALKPLAVSIALALAAGHAYSLPTGGEIEAGQVAITQTTPSRMDIIQGTNSAVVNWNSFSIGAEGHVHFQQPTAQSAILNRVVGNDPSTILGRVSGNGSVFLVNQNGIMVGPGGKIDVGSFVASTANISTENFMAGRYRFEQTLNAASRIVNQGEISVAQGGLVALVGPGVENSGVIRASLGKVALASGNSFTLDLFGDKLVRLAVDDKVMATLTDAQGKPLSAYVSNTGTIVADGGSVLITAAAAKAVLDKVINVSGLIQARSFEERGGQIVLLGGSEGKVEVSGKLDVSGVQTNAKGGGITVTGERVTLTATSSLDASGTLGGGNIKVGGDYKGGGSTPRALTTTVAQGSIINADATQAGDGGQVIVWADGTTRYAGHVSARGGPTGGNGGFIEVSGKESLGFLGTATASASIGRSGTVLLDPGTIRVRESGPTTVSPVVTGGTGTVTTTESDSDSTIEAEKIAELLRFGTNVELQSSQDIVVEGLIDGRVATGGVAGASLFLMARGNIVLKQTIITNNGDVTLVAGRGMAQDIGNVGWELTELADGGRVVPTIAAGTGTISIYARGHVNVPNVSTTAALRVGGEFSDPASSSPALYLPLSVTNSISTVQASTFIIAGDPTVSTGRFGPNVFLYSGLFGVEHIDISGNVIYVAGIEGSKTVVLRAATIERLFGSNATYGIELNGSILASEKIVFMSDEVRVAPTQFTSQSYGGTFTRDEITHQLVSVDSVTTRKLGQIDIASSSVTFLPITFGSRAGIRSDGVWSNELDNTAVVKVIGNGQSSRPFYLVSEDNPRSDGVSWPQQRGVSQSDVALKIMTPYFTVGTGGLELDILTSSTSTFTVQVTSLPSETSVPVVVKARIPDQFSSQYVSPVSVRFESSPVLNSVSIGGLAVNAPGEARTYLDGNQNAIPIEYTSVSALSVATEPGTQFEIPDSAGGRTFGDLVSDFSLVRDWGCATCVPRYSASASRYQSGDGQPIPPSPGQFGNSAPRGADINLPSVPSAGGGGGGAGGGGSVGGGGGIGSPSTPNNSQQQTQGRLLGEISRQNLDRAEMPIPGSINVARLADLGRGGPLSGAGIDVFGAFTHLVGTTNNTQLARSSGEDQRPSLRFGPYFSSGPFESVGGLSKRSSIGGVGKIQKKP
jgi:filamentous hemagglutinin family protein